MEWLTSIRGAVSFMETHLRDDIGLEDVARAAKAIHAAFHPEKLNYGAYGDTGCHLHVHLVPKYRDGYEWGGVFAMNPGQVKLSDSEYAAMIEKIRANL